MIELTRSVRFCIPLAGDVDQALAAPRHNSFAGWPTMAGLGVFYEIEVCCAGEPDATTGYLINIAEIDEAVRRHALPLLIDVVRQRPDRDPAHTLRDIVTRLQPTIDRPVRSVTWRLSPFYRLSMETRSMHRVLIAQQFDFAAAHRLHCPDLDEQTNRDIFGKCNNANGHGHNYRLGVTASVELNGAPPRLRIVDLERIVDEQVIDRFDHTHLNLDTEEFADLNPSVEHIAKTCHDLLREPIAAAGGRLEHVTVWETEKTWCRYPAASAMG
jgi:6-pyruvoyltetrahydropterin/6-carboxytetrahydropterin synthase